MYSKRRRSLWTWLGYLGIGQVAPGYLTAFSATCGMLRPHFHQRHMKAKFRGRYRPSAEQFTALWNAATISMDANVLLATYEFSSRTRRELFALFDSIQERLWVPFRFAEEFHTRRLDVISRQVTSYAEATKTIETLLANLQIKNRHPFVSKTSLNYLEKICDELRKGQQEHEKLFSNDPHFKRISDLLDGKIGTRPSGEEELAAVEEGRKRYDSKTPPGYMDNKKPEPEKFGDYFGWRELLALGKQNHRSLIFVTNDTKADWWHLHDTRKIGPRHELVEEYFKASGQDFYIYSLAEFMRYAKSHLNQSISSASLQEVEEITFEMLFDKVSRAEKKNEPPKARTNRLLDFFKAELDIKTDASESTTKDSQAPKNDRTPGNYEKPSTDPKV